MTKIIWIVFALIVIGNSFFVLPFHFSDDLIVSSHQMNYKKDSLLLHTVFPDSIITVKLNMPASYDALYYKNKPPVISSKHPSLIINVSFLNDLDFLSLIFPFYKSINCVGEISFYSIVKIGDLPDRDSTALIGNIKIYIRLSVKGVCTPLYARTLVENEFANILKKEMDKINADINRPVTVDSSLINNPLIDRVTEQPKARKK